MGYGLGVDLGTTNTAAAVNADGRVEPVRLGSHKPEMPSVVFLRPDGGVLVGEPAQRRGQIEPARLAREFKRRMGDPVPIMLSGTPFSAHALTARLLGQVIDTVTRLYEGPPDRIVVTYPANWGPFKREQLAQAIHLADVTGVTLRTEPEAAAVRYAATERVAPGEIIAVYDLGGGTFDAAVLRKAADGFDLLGKPEGIEQLGGIDFDEVVLEHVRTTLGDALADLDLDNDETNEALARLRHDCVAAKETLSFDTETVVAVALPRLHTRVRINRSQFEAMIAPTIDDTVTAMRRALRSADVRPDQLRCIVLAGGSSRIPLVSQALSTAFERPVALDATPELGIALGAAMLAAPPGARPRHHAPAPAGTAADTPAEAQPAGAPSGSGRAASTFAIGRAPAPAQPSGIRVDDDVAATTGDPGGRRRPYRWAIVGAVVAAVLALTVTTAWPRGGPPAATPGPSAPASSPPTASLLWQVRVASPGTGSPVEADDHIIVGSTDGTVRAFRRSDGKLDWSFPTGGSDVLLGDVLNDLVYAGTADGVLYAFDTATGKQRWRRDSGDRFAARPSAYPNHTYVGGRSGALYSYATGRGRLWRIPTGGEIRTSPVSAGRVAVVASGDRRLYAVDVDGYVVWKPTVGQVVGNPTHTGTVVCVAVDDGSIPCLNVADGSLASRITGGGAALSAPVGGDGDDGDDGTVYAAAADGTIGAWDAATGARRWQVRPAGAVAGGRLQLQAKVLHVLYPNGRLAALDIATGVERWRFTIDDRFDTAPSGGGESVHVLGTSGILYALTVPASAETPAVAPS
jgi:outer membrane protein assembly factor BamB/actin-like ATPase involved in cell morphogenesis